MSKSPADVVRAFVAAINAADPTALRTLMTDDHTFTDARGTSFSGAEKMRIGWQHFFHAYPAYRINIKHSFAESTSMGSGAERGCSGGMEGVSGTVPAWRQV